MVVAALLWTVPAGAHHDDVSPAEDNPEGCTMATGEESEQCGAQGRDHFGAVKPPPIEACADQTTETGSRLTRILPDGPRRADGSLAFISGACVYLPPEFDPSLRYPVIYVLHGGGGDQSNWVTFGDIQGVLDRAWADDPDRAVIAVMPDGRSGQWYDYENGDYLIETYVLDHLIPWIDAHYPTITDRAGRGIVGLSNGGYGAIHLAGKRPDLFITAGGMSSNLGGQTMGGLGESGRVHYQGSMPFQLAENYDEVDLVLDLAVTCTNGDAMCWTIAVDLLFLYDHEKFDDRTDAIDHQGVIDIRYTDGAHQFTWWTPWLENRQLPFMQERMSGPVRPANEPASSTPESFRYRTIQPSFTVWDTSVTMDRDVREFVDLRSVSATGLEIQGSGTATITSAPYFRPRSVITVTGADGSDRPMTVRADDEGRITITADLGPSHVHDQFSNEANVEAAQAGDSYFTKRVLRFDAGRAAPGTGGPTTDDAAPTTEGGPQPAVATVPPTASATTSGPSAGTPDQVRPADGETTDTETRPEVAAETTPVELASAPLAAGIERSPQLVPTVAFLMLLAAGAYLGWRRRTAEES